MLDRKAHPDMTGRTGPDPRGHFASAGLASPASCGDEPSCGVRRASLGARLIALLLQGRFDRMLAVGMRASAGSSLAVHAERIVGFAEREAIARTLQRALRDSREPVSQFVSGGVPVHPQNAAAAEAAIDAVTLRLHSPAPVAARGMARPRLVLSDGTGPFHQDGHGDLDGRLGAALAAL